MPLLKREEPDFDAIEKKVIDNYEKQKALLEAPSQKLQNKYEDRFLAKEYENFKKNKLVDSDDDWATTFFDPDFTFNGKKINDDFSTNTLDDLVVDIGALSNSVDQLKHSLTNNTSDLVICRQQISLLGRAINEMNGHLNVIKETQKKMLDMLNTGARHENTECT